MHTLLFPVGNLSSPRQTLLLPGKPVFLRPQVLEAFTWVRQGLQAIP